MLMPFTLVHLSDFHGAPSKESDQRLRVRALMDDLELLGVRADAVVISGDLAATGAEAEYVYTEQALVTPLCKQLGLDRSLVIMVPGNHDVDRSTVDEYKETGLVAKLTTTLEAERAMEIDKCGAERLANYNAFGKRAYGPHHDSYYTRIHDFKGIKLGFACLNTAWRSSGDHDKGRLFLTEAQVNRCVEGLEDCHLKIAILHHPLTWLHESEHETVIPDLKNQFDVVLSGHLHEPLSVAEQGTSSDCILLSAPAISDGRGPVGYSIYEIDFESKVLSAKYRRFVRTRRAFDADVDHAHEGAKNFTLPTRSPIIHGRAIVAQRIREKNDTYHNFIRDRLQQFQHVGDPIYISPSVERVIWHKDGMIDQPVDNILEDVDQVAFLYGPADTGKSLFMHTLATEINDRIDQGKEIAICLNLTSIPTTGVVNLMRAEIAAALINTPDEAAPRRFTFFIDQVSADHSNVIADVLAAVDENPNWTVLFALSNEIQWLELISRFQDSKPSYFRMKFWGPSRIRKLAKHFYENSSYEASDLEAAADFVINSLGDTDIPATPVIISLYLSVFPAFAGQLSSLSFLRMLEKYEELRFGQNETTASEMLYNKQRFLAMLAAEIYKSKAYLVSSQALEDLVEIYFGSKNLDYDKATFIRSLCDAGFLQEFDGGYQFRCYVFFDYYLAQAFREGTMDISRTMASLTDTIRLSDALAFYGGLRRADVSVAEIVMSQIGEEYEADSRATLADLDKHIYNALLPSEPAEAEQSGDGLPERLSKQDADDREFEDKKRRYAVARSQPVIERADDKIAQLARLMRALQSFYRLFRNLENIDGEDKQRLLDRILDFHVYCNTKLIDLFIEAMADREARTQWAYFVTLGGFEFLFGNIANESLKNTILRALADSKSDYKKLLLTMLLLDLGVKDGPKESKKMAESITSHAGLELLYFKVREKIVFWSGKELPKDLVDAFRAATLARNKRIRKFKGAALYASIEKAVQNVRLDWLAHRATGKGHDEQRIARHD